MPAQTSNPSDGREERWLSVDEITAHLGVARDTIYRWIESKGLPAHRLGKLWKFKVSEVDDWVRSGTGDETKAGPPPKVTRKRR